jgi:hypothetical protein
MGRREQDIFEENWFTIRPSDGYRLYSTIDFFRKRMDFA